MNRFIKTWSSTFLTGDLMSVFRVYLSTMVSFQLIVVQRRFENGWRKPAAYWLNLSTCYWSWTVIGPLSILWGTKHWNHFRISSAVSYFVMINEWIRNIQIYETLKTPTGLLTLLRYDRNVHKHLHQHFRTVMIFESLLFINTED